MNDAIKIRSQPPSYEFILGNEELKSNNVINHSIVNLSSESIIIINLGYYNEN